MEYGNANPTIDTPEEVPQQAPEDELLAASLKQQLVRAEKAAEYHERTLRMCRRVMNGCRAGLDAMAEKQASSDDAY